MEGIKRLTFGLLIFLLANSAFVASSASAAVEKRRQVVYIGQIYDGQGYSGQFYPSNEETIYLLAGETLNVDL